jgi:hypothetical protein
VIDWWSVFTHSLWIVGLAIALAVFSFADWQASARHEGLRTSLDRTLQSPVFWAGIALVCLGAGLGVKELWERIPWFLLTGASAFWASWILTGRRKDLP